MAGKRPTTSQFERMCNIAPWLACLMFDQFLWSRCQIVLKNRIFRNSCCLLCSSSSIGKRLTCGDRSHT